MLAGLGGSLRVLELHLLLHIPAAGLDFLSALTRLEQLELLYAPSLTAGALAQRLLPLPRLVRVALRWCPLVADAELPSLHQLRRGRTPAAERILRWAIDVDPAAI